MVEPSATAAVHDAQNVSVLVKRLHLLLDSAAIENAAQEARDIVAAVMGENRFWPTLNAGQPISAQAADAALKAAALRAHGCPFAYAVGRAAFRHLTLSVDSRVLIPRQETEQLVQLVLDSLQKMEPGIIADIGTGSGAIALALATELPPRHSAKASRHSRESGNPASFPRTSWHMIASDVSSGAIAVAEKNARHVLNEQSCSVEFRCGDMFAVIRETGLRAVVSNPPYITFEEARRLPSSVRNWEPPEALFSAQDGMLAARRLIAGSARVLASGGLLAFEVDSSRAGTAVELVLSNGSFCNVGVRMDLTGRERFVVATRV